ncbi:MAG: EAL domain-containing protein [Schwartzia sp.]|nr:EAL domain-containing protein [Schwartzia sp. (in: firmicutes)]
MGHKMIEQDIVDGFAEAIREKHIYPVYQPQINHSTGRMVGAEALMRWLSPVYGMQSPADFVPVMEAHDLIFRADVHIFASVCRFQRKCLDTGVPTVPISVNMSRWDVFQHSYVEEIEKIRKQYEIPVKLLRIELTESSAIGGMELIVDTIEKLHACGYIVEMDDFGSGYSSLNILKHLDVDIIKLDLGFLEGDIGGRGGIILSSVVQMAKWLGTPLIAEGVETMEQADYMKSLGCDYIQGYLYSKPLPESEFLVKLGQTDHEATAPAMKLVNAMNAGKFWDPDSMETLIFSNFVGAAALFSYQDGLVKILRVNEKYTQELGMRLTEKETIDFNPWQELNEENKRIYEDTIRKAIASKGEETCETWRDLHSKCCGDDRICIRSHIRVIGNAGGQYLIYAMVQNVTAEKKSYQEVYESDQKFRHASEQANFYAWESTIATKEMRPCFRCMRDLGLPALVKNYPEPAIEAGIFPPDYADMYRDWHRRLAEGEPSLEAIIPLTVGRIPVHVRYTTEFDENGKPLKAYGSATLVVDGDKKENA